MYCRSPKQRLRGEARRRSGGQKVGSESQTGEQSPEQTFRQGSPGSAGKINCECLKSSFVFDYLVSFGN